MEKKLKNLFEFQRFAGNKDIDRMMQEAELRYPRELADDELELVAAAGTGRSGRPGTTSGGTGRSGRPGTSSGGAGRSVRSGKSSGSSREYKSLIPRT